MDADKYQSQSSQSGFTIVETLVAMVVVSILMTAIAPIIVLAVGNRVQARRVELATQATKSYLDGVRTGAIAPPSHTIELDEVNNKQFTFQRTKFSAADPPSTVSGLSCAIDQSDYPYCSQTQTSSLYCFDLDGNGCSSNSVTDLVVQAFRSVSARSTDAKKGYLIGVRVYRADAFSDSTPLIISDPENKRTQASFTGGLGNRKAPLVETTTEIVTKKAAFQDFCDRLGGCEQIR